jgi:hypothetical protein
MPVSCNYDVLVERARKIRAPQNLISRLSGIPEVSLSRATNHVADLCYSDWRKIESILADLEEIVRRAGMFVDWKDGAAVQAQLDRIAAERTNPPDTPTHADYELLSLVSGSDGFVGIAANLGCTMSELLERIEGANKRFSYQINQLSKWTECRKAHIDILNQELETRNSTR